MSQQCEVVAGHLVEANLPLHVPGLFVETQWKGDSDRHFLLSGVTLNMHKLLLELTCSYRTYKKKDLMQSLVSLCA